MTIAIPLSPAAEERFRKKASDVGEDVATYIGRMVERLAKDPDSGYSGIDVDDLPEVVDDPDQVDSNNDPIGGAPDDDDFKTPESENTDNRSTNSQVRSRTSQHKAAE